MWGLAKQLFSDDPKATYHFKQLGLYGVVSNNTLSFFTTPESQIARYFASKGNRKSKIYNRLRSFLVEPIHDESEPSSEPRPSPVRKTLDIGDVRIDVDIYEGADHCSFAERHGEVVRVDKDDVTEWVISMTPAHKLFMLTEMFNDYSREPQYLPLEQFAETWFKTNKTVSSMNLKEFREVHELEQPPSLSTSDNTALIVTRALNAEYVGFILRYLEKFDVDPSNYIEIANVVCRFMAEAEVVETVIAEEEETPEDEYITIKVKKSTYDELMKILK